MNEKIRKAFASDPETLRLLEQAEVNDLKKADLLSKLKEKANRTEVFEYIKGEKGEDGKDGIDGKDGEDGEDGIDGVHGGDGKDGRDGVDGIDGKDGKNGKDGSPDTAQQIADKLNTTTETLESSVIKGYLKFDDIIKEIKKGKYLEPRDIKGMPINMNDMRWHGGGSSFTSPLTTKGDLYTFTTVDARLPVGTNGQLLSSDSTAATGLKWITASGTGTVTDVTSNDGSITVTSSTTTPDLAVVKAPKLSTARTINGVAFDGTANITVTAAAGTLTGTVLNATVVTSSLTSVGTITTGVWTGTTIAIANGGTGQTTASAAFNALSPMTTGGDIIYGGASGAGTRLANGSAGQVLTSNGTTLAPSWTSAGSGTVTTVSVVTANGVSGSVANATTTPAITLTLGAITPSSVSTGALTSSSLTAGRVTFAGTAGLLSDDADMTFATDTLTVTKIIGSTSITDSGLTSGRVTFAGTGGLLSDDADMTFATDTLTVTKFGATTLTGTIAGGAQQLNNIVIDASGNTSLKIPSAAGGTTINAAGQVTIDSTSKTLNFYDGAAEQVLNPIKAVTMTIENPTSSEDLVMFYTNSTVTVVRMVTVLVGSATPSVTFKPAFGTDRSAAGTNLITSPSATTNTTGGTTVTSFDNASVGSGSFFRCKTTAQSGTVTQGSITVFYEQAP